MPHKPSGARPFMSSKVAKMTVTSYVGNASHIFMPIKIKFAGPMAS